MAAVGGLRLVQDRRLGLDRDVGRDLRSWRVPRGELTRGHPVTLRGLLRMTGGIGVPGCRGDGSMPADALVVRRAAAAYGWPPLPASPD